MIATENTTSGSQNNVVLGAPGGITQRQLEFLVTLFKERAELQGRECTEEDIDAMVSLWKTIDGKRASEIIGNAITSNKAERAKSQGVAVLTEGFYRYGETVAQVVKSKNGNAYAKVLSADTWTFDYTAGAVRKIKSEDALTIEQASAMGHHFGRCMLCGRDLSNPESVKRGIGPICAGKL